MDEKEGVFPARFSPSRSSFATKNYQVSSTSVEEFW